MRARDLVRDPAVVGIARAAPDAWIVCVRAPIALPRRLRGDVGWIDLVPLSTGPFAITSAIANVAAPLAPLRKHCRPLRAGCGIGTRRTTATLGLFVTPREGVARTFILTAAHPFTTARLANPPRVLQPAGPDGGRERDAVGTIVSHSPIAALGSPEHDAAVVALDPSVEVDFDYVGVGPIRGHRTRLEVGMPLYKLGRTTGATEASILGLDWTGFVDYPSGRRRLTRQLLVHNPRAAVGLAGDSGAVWVTPAGHAVGLHFSATDRGGRFSIATPIHRVLDSFGLLVAARAAD